MTRCPHFKSTDVPSVLQGVIGKTEGSEIPVHPTMSTWAAVERVAMERRGKQQLAEMAGLSLPINVKNFDCSSVFSVRA